MSDSLWFWLSLILGLPTIVAFAIGGALTVFGPLEWIGGLLTGLAFFLGGAVPALVFGAVLLALHFGQGQ